MQPLPTSFVQIPLSLVIASVMTISGTKPYAEEASPSPVESRNLPGVNLPLKGRFRHFWNTISPDGKYVFGWGLPGAGSGLYTQLPNNSEILFPREQLDTDGPQNFLVDAIHGRVLATLPNFHFFERPEGTQNRHHLLIGWSLDSRAAVAIYRAQWGNGDDSEAISYIHPAGRRSFPILDQVSAALQRILPYKTKQGDPKFNPFIDPVLVDSKMLVMDAANYRETDNPHYDYRLKFHIEIKEARRS